jgi:hypothetical protein
MQFNLSKLQAPRQTIKTRDYPKVKTILEEVDQLIKNAVASNEDDEEVVLSVDERKFYEAYDEHWVHAANRTVLTHIFASSSRSKDRLAVPPRHLHHALNAFRRTLQDCRRLAADANKWSLPGSHPHISRNRSESMIELAFLRGYLALKRK